MKQYKITGMSCAACSSRVEKAVSKLANVDSCAVNLLTGNMSVEGAVTDEEVVDAVIKAGYGVQMDGASQEYDDYDGEVGIMKKRLISSVIILIPLMYFSMGTMMWGWPEPDFFKGNEIGCGLLQMMMTTVIMVINQKFFISGFKSILNRAPNMDALVSLGAGAAYVYSTVALFMMTRALSSGDNYIVMDYMHHFYFESAGMILTLITLGKLLEARSKGKTTNAIEALMNLAPKTANVIRDGQEISIPIEKVIKGDVFTVRPGESLPVDGIILEGITAIDESSLTGESIPVDKGPGDEVSAATINQAGFIMCEAVRVGENTTLAKVIKMVNDASATKAPIAKIADKVSGIFVPTVILIAIITFISWLLLGQTVGFSLARSISVLVISCPCALGLATPVAIMVGSGLGARNGILFKTAEALENTGKIKVVALDKTGTITEGHPRVTDVLPAKGSSMIELKKLAYSLEMKSEHPLAKAIVDMAKEENIESFDVEDFIVLPGNGLSARYNEDILTGGSLSFAEQQFDIPISDRELVESLSTEGKTPLVFGKNNCFIGVIAVADTIKEDSKTAITELRKSGIKVVMLTGDNRRTAETIGKIAGVDEVVAEVMPNEKAQAIGELSSHGSVMMVGDGINDAPALTCADIGVAIGAGTDIAIDAADVVLMSNSLMDVGAAIKLSRKTLKTIRQNLFWAFIYNVAGIPLAAGLFIGIFGWQLNPMFAAAAMSLSSLCVVTNALRLNFNKIKNKKIIVAGENVEKQEEKTMNKTMEIEGMMCTHCEARVKKVLEAIDGVETADVSHEKGIAEVKLATNIEDEVLRNAVEAQDYIVLNIK